MLLPVGNAIEGDLRKAEYQQSSPFEAHLSRQETRSQLSI
jgi:hypothetical protein